MALMDRAVLELTVDGKTGQFHLVGAEPTEDLSREFLMGPKGQLINEAFDVGTDDDGDGGGSTDGQEGWYADAGQGTDTITLTYEAGYDDDEYGGIPLQWGDGSSGTDRWDATGAHPITQAQVLNWWARNARTDSFRSPAKLYWGEWTDGSLGGDAGIFGEPIDVALTQVRIERDARNPSTFEGTVELVRMSTLSSGGGSGGGDGGGDGGSGDDGFLGSIGDAIPEF